MQKYRETSKPTRKWEVIGQHYRSNPESHKRDTIIQEAIGRWEEQPLHRAKTAESLKKNKALVLLRRVLEKNENKILFSSSFQAAEIGDISSAYSVSKVRAWKQPIWRGPLGSSCWQEAERYPPFWWGFHSGPSSDPHPPSSGISSDALCHPGPLTWKPHIRYGLKNFLPRKW